MISDFPFSSDLSLQKSDTELPLTWGFSAPPPLSNTILYYSREQIAQTLKNPNESLYP